MSQRTASLSAQRRSAESGLRALTYIVTDTFSGPSVVTPRYGIDRTRLDGSADYALTHWVTFGVGGRYIDTCGFGAAAAAATP